MSNITISSKFTDTGVLEIRPDASSSQCNIKEFDIVTKNGATGFHNQGFHEDEDEKPKSTITTSTKIENAEASNFNSYQQVPVKHPTSFWGTIFHLIFLSASSPLLLIPNAFMKTGIVVGSVTLTLSFALYVCCIRMLLWSSTEMYKLLGVPNMSYSDLVYATFETGPSFVRPLAKIARFFINCNFTVAWYGGSVLTFILMADSLQTICSGWLKLELQVHDIVLILFVPVLFLNLVRNLKFLEPCSTVGLVFNFITISMVLYYSITDPDPWQKQNLFDSLDGIPSLLGTIFININVTGLVISLKNEMKHPQKFEAPCGVLNISYFFIFIIIFLFSMFFSLKYGEQLPENVLSIIPSSLTLYLIAAIFYAIGLYLLIPLLFYVPLNVILNAVSGKKSANLNIRSKLRLEYGLRVFLIALAVIIAYMNPNISFFVTLLGTASTSIDSFIYPAVIHSLVVWRIGDKKMKTVLILMKNLVLCILGICLMIGGIQNSLS